MTKLLRNLIIFVVVVLCLAIIGFAFALPGLEKRARREIAEQLSEKLDAKVELRAVKLNSIWPLGLRVQNLRIVPTSKLYRIEMERMLVRFHYLPKSYLEIVLERPFIEYVGDVPDKPKDVIVTAPVVGSSKAGVGGGILASLAFKFSIIDGILAWSKDEVTNVKIQRIQLTVDKAKLLEPADPFKFVLFSELQYTTPWLTGVTSVRGESQDLRLSPTGATSENTQVEIGGLLLRASGRSDFNLKQHNWRIFASIEDLQKLPKPPDVIPARNWQGKFQLDATFDKLKDQTNMQGIVKFEKGGMHLKLDSANIKASGPARFDGQAQFRLQNATYEIKNAHLNADLSAADIQYSDLFRKAALVPFTLAFKGGWASDSLNVETLNLRLFTLTAQAQGKMGLSEPGKLQWQTAPISLSGWERLILPLAGSPLAGAMEVKGTASGSLAKTDQLVIDVAKLRLKDLKGTVKYKSEDGGLNLFGPIAANAEGFFSVHGKNVKAASLTVRADLTGLEVRKTGIFEKKAGERFQVSGIVKHQQQDLVIERSEMKLSFANFSASGRVRNPMDPELDLAITADIPSLDALKARLPTLKSLPLSGSTQGRFTVKGKMASGQPWFQWPMKVVGSLKYAVQKFLLPPSAVAAAPSGAGGPAAESAAPPGPFLQKGYLTEHLDLLFVANIGRFAKEALAAENILAKGRVVRGTFAGNVSAQTFGGSVQVKNVSLPLFVSDPRLAADVKFSGVRVESLLEFLQPAFRDAAKGPANGEMRIETQLPGAAKLMEKLAAKGNVNSDDIWINTAQLTQMINEQISNIPGVPKNAVKMEPIQGRLTSTFQLANQLVQPLVIDGYDKGGSEFHLSGSVSLDKAVDLKGNFLWANAPLSGCIKEGNADNKGRVNVPIVLKGSVISPSWQIAGNALTKMGEKALKCEAVKAIQKSLPSALPKDVGDALKKILGR